MADFASEPRCWETSTTGGTGSLTLAGIATDEKALRELSVLTNGVKLLYQIRHKTLDEYEFGLGTWNTGATLDRNTVYRSSNSNAAVNFTAGTVDVTVVNWPGIVGASHTITASTVTLSILHHHVYFNSSSNIICTLPPVADYQGKEFVLKSINSGMVRIEEDSGDTNSIEGRDEAGTAGTYITLQGRDWLTLISDGTTWRIMDKTARLGRIEMHTTTTAPSGYLFCDGAAVSLTTYEELYDLIGVTAGALSGGGTFTTDFATNNKLTHNAHPYSNDDVVVFTTSGTLPAGLSVDTKYYVINAAANDYEVSTTRGGSSVTLTDDGTGTHTDNASFGTPDMRGRVPLNMDDMGTGEGAGDIVTDGAADTVFGTGGVETHALSEAELPSHKHSLRGVDGASNVASTTSGNLLGESDGGDPQYDTSGTVATTLHADSIDSTGSDTAHTNKQPYIALAFVIKA